MRQAVYSSGRITPFNISSKPRRRNRSKGSSKGNILIVNLAVTYLSRMNKI